MAGLAIASLIAPITSRQAGLSRLAATGTATLRKSNCVTLSFLSCARKAA
jgi:hypothetical protein